MITETPKLLVVVIYASDRDGLSYSRGIFVQVDQSAIDRVVSRLDKDCSGRIVEPSPCGTNQVYLLEDGNVRTLKPIFPQDPNMRRNSIHTYALDKLGSDRLADALGLPRVRAE